MAAIEMTTLLLDLNKNSGNKNDIETLFGIGGDNKSNSSSWILKKWKENN